MGSLRLCLGWDVGPLKVTEFTSQDSWLPLGNLNHVQADTFMGKPLCLEWPNDRTCDQSCQIDAIDPLRTLKPIHLEIVPGFLELFCLIRVPH